MHPPKVYPIKSIKQETADIFTIVLSLTERGGEFAFLPGQFNMLYLFGFGEAAISVSGNPDKKTNRKPCATLVVVSRVELYTCAIPPEW